MNLYLPSFRRIYMKVIITSGKRQLISSTRTCTRTCFCTINYQSLQEFATKRSKDIMEKDFCLKEP